jgi:hypothetical protein
MTPDFTHDPRQIIRYHTWTEVGTLRTEDFTARQYDDGDVYLTVVDRSTGRRSFYDDMVDEVLEILDKANI